MASSTIQGDLVISAFIMFLCWYLAVLWSRRHLYIFSWKVPGPFSLPVIGGAYIFLSDLSPSGVLRKVINTANSYSQLWKIWFGPHLLLFLTEPKHIEEILTNKNSLHKNFVYEKIAYGIGTTLLTAEVSKWKSHRKIIAPTFNQTHLNSYVSVFVQHAKIFCDELSQYIGTKNLITYSLFSTLTVDASTENLWGLTINAQRTNDRYPQIIKRYFEIIISRAFNICLSSDIMFKLSPLSKEFDKLIKDHHQISNTIIERKKKEHELRKLRKAAEVEEGFDEETKPFLEAAIEKSYFSDEDLRDEAELLVAAANDTTATTLTFLFEILGLYQDVQQKVYEEAIEVLGEVRDVESSDLHQLKYTEMVIKETLRLFPPLPFFMRELGEDIDIGETILPRGASVVVSPFNIHRRANLWPDPLKFDPDRFLPDQVRKRHPCAYIPFSYGPRNCIGAQYGMMNLKTIVATVIRKYIIFSDYKSIDDIMTNLTLTLRMEGDPKISVALRGPTNCT